MEFNFKIVTQTDVKIDDVTTEVMLCGSEGYFTIFANHSPFVSVVVPSTGYYMKDGQLISFSITSGFCEVNDNTVTVITNDFKTESIKKPSDAYDNTVKLLNMEKEQLNEYFN